MDDQDDYEGKLESLRKYIPFLINMMTELKAKGNREAQLNKMQSLHDMITNSKNKLKVETLKRCEDVLRNIYFKVNPQLRMKYSLSSPSLSTENNVMPEIESTSFTPASPSPPPNSPLLRTEPVTIPTEKISSTQPSVVIQSKSYLPKIDVYSNVVINNPIKVANPILPDMSKPPISLDDLKTLEDDVHQKITDSYLTHASVNELQEYKKQLEVQIRVENVNSTMTPLEEQEKTLKESRSSKESKSHKESKKHKESKSSKESKSHKEGKSHKGSKSHKESKTSKESKSPSKNSSSSSSKSSSSKSDKHHKKLIQKVLKEPDSIFGSALSSIDEKLIGEKKNPKKADRRSSDVSDNKKESAVENVTESIFLKKCEDSERKSSDIEKSHTPKPEIVYKRLADKYNPKPRQKQVEAEAVDVEKKVAEVIEKNMKANVAMPFEVPSLLPRALENFINKSVSEIVTPGMLSETITPSAVLCAPSPVPCTSSPVHLQNLTSTATPLHPQILASTPSPVHLQTVASASTIPLTILPEPTLLSPPLLNPLTPNCQNIFQTPQSRPTPLFNASLRNPPILQTPNVSEPAWRNPQIHQTPDVSEPAWRNPQIHQTPDVSEPTWRNPQIHQTPDVSEPTWRNPQIHQTPDISEPAWRNPQIHQIPDVSEPVFSRGLNFEPPEYAPVRVDFEFDNRRMEFEPHSRLEFEPPHHSRDNRFGVNQRFIPPSTNSYNQPDWGGNYFRQNQMPEQNNYSERQWNDHYHQQWGGVRPGDPRSYKEYKEMKEREARANQENPKETKDPRLAAKEANNLVLAESKDPRLSKDVISRDPRLSKLRDRSKHDGNGTTSKSTTRETYNSKFDKMYSNTAKVKPHFKLEKTEEESFVSPLDSLYVSEKGKTGRGYGVQHFKIPKKSRKPEDIKPSNTKNDDSSGEENEAVSKVESETNDVSDGEDTLEESSVPIQPTSSKSDLNEIPESSKSDLILLPDSPKPELNVSSESSKPDLNVLPTVEENKQNMLQQIDLSRVVVCIKSEPSDDQGLSWASPDDDEFISEYDRYQTNDVEESDKNDVSVIEEPSSTQAEISPEPNKENKSDVAKPEESSEQNILAHFFENLLKSKNKKDKKSALFSLIETFSDSFDEKEINKIRKIIHVEENTEEESEEEKEAEAVKQSNEVGSTTEDLPEISNTEQEAVAESTVDDKSASDGQEPLVTKNIAEPIQESVGERIKSRKRNLVPKTKKKPKSELELLHADIQDMFIRDGVVTATGKRMCRILKSDPNALESPDNKKIRKKPGPKPKHKLAKEEIESGAKAVRIVIQKMPDDIMRPTTRLLRNQARKTSYAETDIDSDKGDNEPLRNETEELGSDDDDKSQSDETPSRMKGPRKIRRGRQWASGIIPKLKRKKSQEKIASKLDVVEPDKSYYLDYTDKTKLICKLCDFSGHLLTNHYVKEHPESEVFCSRMSPRQAVNAINDYSMNSKIYENIIEDKNRCLNYDYSCRICGYSTNTKPIAFYEHVTLHTGEYRHRCDACGFTCGNGKALAAHCRTIHEGQEKQVSRTNYKSTIVFGYLCGECNYLQLNQKNVQEHVNIFHLGDKPIIFKINMSEVLDPNIETLNINKNKELPEEPSPVPKLVEQTPTKRRRKPGPKSKTRPDEVSDKVDEDLETNLKDLITPDVEKTVIDNKEPVLVKKKPGPKSKTMVLVLESSNATINNVSQEAPLPVRRKPGPKSKTRIQKPSPTPEVTTSSEAVLQASTPSNAVNDFVREPINKKRRRSLDKLIPEDSTEDLDTIITLSSRSNRAAKDKATAKLKSLMESGEVPVIQKPTVVPEVPVVQISAVVPEVPVAQKPTVVESEKRVAQKPSVIAPAKESVVEKNVVVPSKKEDKIKSIEPDLNVFTCKTDIMEEDAKLTEERLRKMNELNKSIGSRESKLDFVNKLCNRLNSEQSPESSSESITEPIKVKAEYIDVPSYVAFEMNTQQLGEVNIPVMKTISEIRSTPCKKPVLDDSPVLPQANIQFKGKSMALFSNIIEKLQGKVNEAAVQQDSSDSNSSPSPLSPFEDSTAPTLIIGQFVKATRKHAGVVFSCLVNNCYVVTKDRLVFQLHCKFGHKDISLDSTLCDKCGIVLESTKDTTLLENTFDHLVFAHSDFLEEKSMLLRTRRLSGDKLSVKVEKDKEPDKPVESMATLELAHDNPFSFKIVDVMSLADTSSSPPETTPPQPQFIGTEPRSIVIPQSIVVTQPTTQPIVATQPIMTTQLIMATQPIVTTQPFVVTEPIVTTQPQAIGTKQPQLKPVPPLTPITSPSTSVVPSTTTYSSPSISNVFKQKPSSNQLIVKEAKLTASELSRPRKACKALQKFVETPADLYKCPHFYCMFSTKVRTLLERHLKIHRGDGDGMVACVYCDIKTPWEHVPMHIDIRHAQCEYACNYCLYRGLLKEYVCLHQHQSHASKEFVIVQVPPKSTKIFSLDESSRITDYKALCEPYRCYCNDLTQIEFLFENEFETHLKTYHCGAVRCGYPKCTHMGFASNMLDHWSASHAISKYQCGHCKTSNGDLMKMYQHFIKFHPSLKMHILARHTEMESTSMQQIEYGYTEKAFFMLGHIRKLPQIGLLLGSKGVPTIKILKMANNSSSISVPTIPSSSGSLALKQLPAIQQRQGQPAKAQLPSNIKLIVTTTSSEKFYFIPKLITTVASTSGVRVQTSTVSKSILANNTFESHSSVQPQKENNDINTSQEPINNVITDQGSPEENFEEPSPTEDEIAVSNLPPLFLLNEKSPVTPLEHVVVPDNVDDVGRLLPEDVDPLTFDDSTLAANLSSLDDPFNIIPPIIMEDPLNIDFADPMTASHELGASRSQLGMFNRTNSSISISASDDDGSGSIAYKEKGLSDFQLYQCAVCREQFGTSGDFKTHLINTTTCKKPGHKPFQCAHCDRQAKTPAVLIEHIQSHGVERFICSLCDEKFTTLSIVRAHIKNRHNIYHTNLVATDNTRTNIETDFFVVKPTLLNTPNTDVTRTNISSLSTSNSIEQYTPEQIDSIPNRQIFGSNVKCGLCSYQTKVRVNIVRHLQMHADEKSVPDTAPVNPVPCLEKNEKMFDKMINLAASSITTGRMGGPKSDKEEEKYPEFVATHCRFVCCAQGCSYLCPEEGNLKHHMMALHRDETNFTCAHCKCAILPCDAETAIKHFKLHGLHLYKCQYCSVLSHLKHKVEKHITDSHDGPVKVITIRYMESEPVEGETLEPSLITTPKSKPWRCCMCKVKCATKEDIHAHIVNKHEVDAQYKCTLCTFKNDKEESFQKHFDEEHPGHNMDIIFVYHKVEDDVPKEDNFDTTPLWQRDKPRVRHIRGILFDETSPPPAKVQKKSVKSSPISKAPAQNSDHQKVSKTPVQNSDPHKNLLDSIDAVAKGTDSVHRSPVVITDTQSEMVTKSSKSATNEIKEPKLEEPTENTRLSTDDVQIIQPPVNVIVLDSDESDTENGTPSTAKKLDDPGSLKESVSNSKLENSEAESQNVRCSKYHLTALYGGFGTPHKRQWRCPKCHSFKSRRVADFFFHIFKDFNVFRYKCKLCCDLSISFKYMLDHIKQHPGVTESIIEALPPHVKLETWIHMVIREQSVMILKNYTPMPKKPLAGETGFKCLFCEERSETLELGCEHMLYHWQVVPYECVFCTAQFYNESDLRSHCQKEHGNSHIVVMPKGPVLHQVIKEIELSYKRGLEVSDDRPAKRSKPNDPEVIKIDSDDDLLVVSATDENLVYCCELCAFMSGTEPLMQQHLSEQHFVSVPKFHIVKKNMVTDNLRCNWCPISLPEIELRDHFMINHPGQYFIPYKYQCKHCIRRYINVAKIKQHYTKSHPERRNPFLNHADAENLRLYKCSLCSYTAIQKLPILIKAHMRSHFRPLKCNHCGVLFKMMRFVKLHHSKAHPDLELDVETNAIMMADYLKHVDEVVKTATLQSQTAVAKKSTGASTSISTAEEYSYYGLPAEKIDLGKINSTFELDGLEYTTTVEDMSKMINIDPYVDLSDCNVIL